MCKILSYFYINRFVGLNVSMHSQTTDRAVAVPRGRVLREGVNPDMCDGEKEANVEGVVKGSE